MTLKEFAEKYIDENFNSEMEIEKEWEYDEKISAIANIVGDYLKNDIGIDDAKKEIIKCI